MDYQINAKAISSQDASILIKNSSIEFGTTEESTEGLPNPAELFLGSVAACVLKNVERFSKMMNFSYSEAHVRVSATRLENPPRMDHVQYLLTITSDDTKLNLSLLKKNVEKFGTIYNTVGLSSTISGTINRAEDV